MVLSKIGNSAPMNVMNIMLISDDGNIRIASGIHATAGMGRSTSSDGSTVSSNARYRLMARPKPIPTIDAALNPTSTLMMLASRCIGSLGECSRCQNACATSVGAGTFAIVTKPSETLYRVAICHRPRQATRDAHRQIERLTGVRVNTADERCRSSAGKSRLSVLSNEVAIIDFL